MKAFLILEDGNVFTGTSIGSTKEVISEIVFNTSMTGYLEVLTDPSYAGQAVVMTYPLIGNYGITPDMESGRPWPDGYIVRELSRMPSNFRCEGTVQDFLTKHDIPGIAGIDTRALTKILREKGTMNGMITTNENYNVDLIKDIKKSQPELSVVGWIEETLQTAENPDLGKIASDLDILTIKGSSNLLVKGSNLFVDDLDGCLIDSDTSYKLFGSSNCVGKEIIYNDRHLIVRGILKGSKANIMIQAIEGSSQVLNGLIIDGTGLTLNKIEDFKMKFGINEMAINGNVYYIISKFYH